MADAPERRNKMIKDENYIMIQGFMLNRLRLKGNELLIYACIYGFTQAEGQWFSGSIEYLTEWTGASRQTVISTLQNLCDKNLIEKKEEIKNGTIKKCFYKINSEANEQLGQLVHHLQNQSFQAPDHVSDDIAILSLCRMN